MNWPALAEVWRFSLRPVGVVPFVYTTSDIEIPSSRSKQGIPANTLCGLSAGSLGFLPI